MMKFERFAIAVLYILYGIALYGALRMDKGWLDILSIIIGCSISIGIITYYQSLKEMD